MPFKPPPNFEVPSGKAFRTHVFHVLPTGRLVPGLLMIGPNSLLFMPFPSRTAAYAAKFRGKVGNNLAISYVTVENIMTCVALESPLFSYTKTHVIRALSCLDSADNKRVASQIQLIKSVGQEASGEIIHILPAIVPPRMKREKYRTLNLEFLRKILSFKTKYHLHGVSTISNNNVSSAILALRLDQLVGQNAGEPPLNHRFLRIKTYDGRLFTFFGLPRKIVSTLAELTGYLLGHHAGTRDAAAVQPASPGDLLPGDSATLSCADASEQRESSSDAPTKARRRLKVKTNAPAQAISLRPGDESSCSDVLSELSFLSNESDVAATAGDGDAADGLDGPRTPGASRRSGPAANRLTESTSTQSTARHDASRRLAVGYMKLLHDHLHKDLIESTSGTENFSYYGFEPPLIPALRGPATYSRYARRARHYHSKASSNALKNEESTQIVQDAGVVDSANLLLYLTVKTDVKAMTKEQARRKFDKQFMTCAYYRWAASTAYGSHVDEFAPYDKLTKYAATESALNDSGQLQRYWDMMAADVGVTMQKLKARLQCACFDVMLPSDTRFHREVRQLRLRTEDLSDSDLLIDIPIVKEPFKNRSKARQIIRASKEVLRKSLEVNDINVSESETDVSGCLVTRSGSHSDDPAHDPGRKAGGRGKPGGAGKDNGNDGGPGAGDDGPASRDSNGLAAHLGRPSKVLRRESLEVRLEDCFDHATLFGKSLAAESRLVAVTRAMLQKADQEGPASLTAELVDQRINIMILECLDVIANSNVLKEIARNIEYYTLVMPVRDGEILNLFKDYASKPTLDEKVPLNAADQMFSYKNLYLNYVPSATLVRLIKEEQAKHEEELRNKILQAGGKVDADAPLAANYSLGNKFVNHTASSILNIEEVKFLIHNFHKFHELGTPISNYKLCLTYSVKRDGSHISNIFRATSAAFQSFAAKHYLLETERDKKERIENAGKIHSLTQAKSRTGMEGTSLLVLQLQNGWRCGAYITEPLTTDSKPHGTQDNFVFSIYPPGGAGSAGGADSAGSACSMGSAAALGALGAPDTPDASAAPAAATAGAGPSTGSGPGSMLIVSQDGLPVNSEYTNEKVFSPLKLEEDIAKRFTVFPGTTANKVYQVGTATNITIGAGGSSALSINDTLKFVTTGKSETYANNYLFEGEVFPKFMRGRIINLEVLSVVVVDRFKR